VPASGELDPLDHALVRFPVLTRPAMTAEDARAEQLLRASRAHPLLPDLSLSDGSVDAQKLASALSGPELASRLRLGLIAVDPDEYAALPASSGAFLEALGVSSVELRDAAVRMLQLSEHRATSLLPQPASTPVLTLSSEAVFAAPSAAHLVALSEGRAFAAQDALPHHYALRSLPQTLAHALDALTHARAGTSPAELSEVIDTYRARVEGSLSFEQLREGEARRFAIELEVAQGLDDAGVLERYGLFSSDAGLSCALFGSVAQEPCDAQQFVLDASLAVVRRLGLVSGSRERVRVEGLSLGTPTSWDAELSRELREGRVYLVDREEKRALGAFSMAPLTRLPVRQVFAQSSAFDVPLLELLAFRVPGEGCSACRPSSVCEATRCDLGVCVRSPVPDGATCGQGQCVAGACDTPGCGDGVRSDGTGVAPYEACDDGNLVDGDGCSESCVPELRSLEPSIAEGHPAGPARAVAVDGLGQQLLVYSADTLDGEQVSVRAARLDAFGVLAESERVVDASLPRGYLAAPSVAGLRDGGFAIVYSSPSIAGGAGIGVRMLSPRGVLGPLLRVDDGDALDGIARVSPLDEGFVVVWTRKRTNESTELRVRRFDDQGSAVAAAFSVGSAGEGREQIEPAIISSQGQVLIVWTERGGPGGSALLGRRFVGFGTPADALPFEIARGSVAEASLAVLSSDDYLVAFTNRASDAAGDVWRRVVRRFGTPLGAGEATAWVTTSAAESLPVVAGLGSAAVLAFQQGFQPSFAALIGDAAQTSALDSVSAALSLSDRQDVSLASSPNGVWVVWSEKQDRRRALFAYLLPPNEAP
jgi:cysteine-rich repeat protein